MPPPGLRGKEGSSNRARLCPACAPRAVPSHPGGRQGGQVGHRRNQMPPHLSLSSLVASAPPGGPPGAWSWLGGHQGRNETGLWRRPGHSDSLRWWLSCPPSRNQTGRESADREGLGPGGTCSALAAEPGHRAAAARPPAPGSGLQPEGAGKSWRAPWQPPPALTCPCRRVLPPPFCVPPGGAWLLLSCPRATSPRGDRERRPTLARRTGSPPHPPNPGLSRSPCSLREGGREGSRSRVSATLSFPVGRGPRGNRRNYSTR